MKGLLKLLSALARLFSIWQQNKDNRAGAKAAYDSVEEKANGIVQEAEDAAGVVASDARDTDSVCDDDPFCRD